MGAIAGITGKGRMDLVRAMMETMARRGQARIVEAEAAGAAMAGAWSNAEALAVPSAPDAVWDGVRVDPSDGAGLEHETGPFAIAAVIDGELVLARDPIGLKPLYYGSADGEFAFASEVKALLPYVDEVREFPPGSTFKPSRGFARYADWPVSMQKEGELADEPEKIAVELRQRLSASIERRLGELGAGVKGRMGIWLSGGVDSSVIGALAVGSAGTLHSFVAGAPGAPDIEYGAIMARHLGTRHHVITVTPGEMDAALPEVIGALESFDALLVRSSVMNYLASKAASGYADAVLSGECGDELFAGYEYIKGIPEDAVAAELVDIIGRLHNTALQRVDRCARSNGIAPLVPFADRDVMEYALRIPVKYKIRREGGEAIEKWILRKSAEGLVPDAVLWRPKSKFWQGSGSGEALAAMAEDRVSDGDFKRERVLANGWVLNTKEEMHYYRIFRERFGAMRSLDWMGRTKGAPRAE